VTPHTKATPIVPSRTLRHVTPRGGGSSHSARRAGSVSGGGAMLADGALPLFGTPKLPRLRV
jgi:hypothetical protein